MTDIDEIFERAIARAEETEAAQLRELADAGIPPASREGETWAGMHLFGIGLRLPSPEVAEVRLNLSGDCDLSWGGSWPHSGARVDAREFLNAITGAWPLVGQAYRRQPGKPRPGTAEIVPEADGGPLPALGILHDGTSMTVSVGSVRHAFGRESVIVAQVLMAVAERIAGHLPQDAVEALAWRRRRAETDLPPLAMGGDAAPDTFDEETAWYAAKVGLPVVTYRLAALDVMSRQVTHPETGAQEPAPGEWHPGHVPEGLAPERTAPIAERAAAIFEVDPTAFERHAVGTRKHDAFQAIFYGGRFEVPTRGREVTLERR